MKVAYEEKFIVINKKHLSALSVKEISELARLIDKIPSDNKYYVCNQDEPYADKVLDIILSGEDEKSKRTFPGPGEYCTGQQWVDAGGSWEEFVAAHKADPEAAYFNGRCWVPLSLHDYTDPKSCYRLRLNDKGELLKPEEKVICANCKKAVQKAIIEETYYFCCDDCVREGAAKLLDTEYVKIRKKREVPLINPLKIPLGYWVTKDLSSAWHLHAFKPELVNYCWKVRQSDSFSLYFGKDIIEWDAPYEDCCYTRAEILERWKLEYGDRWLEVAEEEQNVHTDC